MNNFTENRTVKSLMLASILALGINTAYANDLAPVPKVAEEHPQGTLDKLAGQPIPNTDPVQYYPSDGSAYTLTKVQEGGNKPAEDNIVTQFDYDKQNYNITPVYYRLDLKQTTYGEGNSVKYYGWTNDGYGNKKFGEVEQTNADITVNYNSTTSSRYENTTDNSSLTIDSNFVGIQINNGANVYGGAIYNNGQDAKLGTINGDFINNGLTTDAVEGGAIFNNSNATIDTINGNFVGNFVHSTTINRAYGGALENESDAKIGTINGNFIGNYAQKDTYKAGMVDTMGGAIINWGDIDIINGDFIGNYAIVNSSEGGSSYGGALANWGDIDIINGAFIGNYTKSANYASGGAIYNTQTINNIIGDFIGNYAASDYGYTYGGAVANAVANAKIDNIIGDFIGNNGFSNSGQVFGAAIYNYQGLITNIEGNFIGNYVKSNSGFADGGAISNAGTITNISGNFMGNYAQASSAYAYGGVIYNSNGTIGKITGDFIGNYAKINSLNNNMSIARSGAIYNYSNNSETKIGNITGDFIGNYAEAIGANTEADGGAICNLFDGSLIESIAGNFINNHTISSNGYSQGGAIFNYNNGEIQNLTGDFINNYAQGTYAAGGAISNNYGKIGTLNSNFTNNRVIGQNTILGGAIYNGGSTVDTISGNFYNNTAESTNGNAQGGAIYNGGSTITNIIGDFKNNSIKGNSEIYGGAIYNSVCSITTISGNFTDNYAEAQTTYAKGGAIYNNKSNVDLTLLNSSFTNNYAKAISGTAYGGAIYTSSNLNIIADNSNIEFTGNYIEDPTQGKINNAVFVGTSNTNSPTITLKTQNNGKIIFNDTIDGGAISNSIVDRTYQYNINLTGDNTGTISLYNDITNANISSNNNTIDLANGEIKNYDFVSMNAGENSRLNLDIDFTNKTADTITTTNLSSGSLILNTLNILSTTEDVVTIQIIKNTDSNSTLQLALGDNVHIMGNMDADTPWLENIMDYIPITVNNNDIFAWENGLSIVTTDTINDSIKIDHNLIYDTLDLIASKVTPDDRNFNFITADNYNLSKDLSVVSEGTLNINGLGVTTPSTINAQDHTLFDLQNDTTLNIKDVVIENSKDFAINAENTNSVVNLTNTSIKNTNGTGIISNIDLNITADGAKSEFSGNKIAFDIKGTDKTLTLKAINEGEITLADIVKGVDGFNVKLTGDDKSKINVNNNINNANLNLENTNLYLSKEDLLNNSLSLTLNSGNINLQNNSIGTMHLPTLNLNGTTNLSLDVDLANESMDRITADNYNVITDAIFNVNQLNLISTTSKESVKILFADEPLAGNVKYSIENNISYNGTNTIYSPIYKYNVSYGVDAEDKLGYFFFNRGGAGSGGNASDGYNPSVLSSPVAAQSGAYATQNATFNYAFQHADSFMPLPAIERFALRNANKYAITGYDKLDAVDNEFRNKAIWVRPYTSFENIPLKNGPKVDTITYGTLIGGDSDFKELRNGWGTIFTGYIGYNGSSQSYSGVNTYQNGGLIGATQTFYKGNFFTALTASAGATAGESHNMYGHENFSSLMAGVANKSGYNIEFKEGKFIIQPTLMLAYSFINTFDYTNSAGVKINSDPLHAIQINPNVKFIGNLKNGWQPYASVGMVWNILDDTKVMANDVRLPEMSVKPYVEYGVGVQKRWKDRCTGYLQAMIRNGGRNGIVLTGGFRWAIGKEGKPIEKVSNPQNKTAQASNNDRKILKQLSPAQRTALGAKPQNTTRTSCIGEVK